MSSFSRGLTNPLYLHERRCSTRSKKWSVRRPITITPSKCLRTLSVSVFKNYMQLYILSDICMLADVYLMFQNNSLNEYQLDPAYQVSAPQLAWNALSKTHQPIDSADHRSGDVPDDSTKHLRRHLPRQCLLRSSQQRADGIAVRPDIADNVHDRGVRE